jgi:hypothetical protein
MFWDKWIPKKYLVKSTICGVEVVFTDSGYKVSYSILKKQSNKLEISESGGCDTISSLPAKIKKGKIPLVLNITGKGVIIKKTNYNSDQELNLPEFIQQNLPAINPDDFYIQILKQNNSTCFISVIRKVQFDALLKEINENKFEVADVIIGPAAIVAINSIITGYNYVYAGDNRVELLNGNVENISIRDTDLTDIVDIEVDGLKIRRDQTLAFSAAFGYITSQNSYVSKETNLVKYKSDHLERNKIKTTFYFFVIVAFVVSLINFFFFSNYFSTNNKLQSELDVYQGKYEQINELLTGYEKKKGLIEQTGLLENNFLSKYSDRIASTIPDEVVLTEFYLNPQIIDRSGEDSLMNFRKNTIILKGNCHKSLIINEWVNVLKTQNFIKDVNLEKFSFNNEGNQPNFEIKIITE